MADAMIEAPLWERPLVDILGHFSLTPSVDSITTGLMQRSVRLTLAVPVGLSDLEL